MVPHIWGALGATLSPTVSGIAVHDSLAAHTAFTHSWRLCNGRKTSPLIPVPFPSFLKKCLLGKPFSLLLTEKLFLGGTEGTRSPERARPGGRCGLDVVKPPSLAGGEAWLWPGFSTGLARAHFMVLG